MSLNETDLKAIKALLKDNSDNLRTELKAEIQSVESSLRSEIDRITVLLENMDDKIVKVHELVSDPSRRVQDLEPRVDAIESILDNPPYEAMIREHESRIKNLELARA